MVTEMEAMPELAEIKSEIGGVDFGAHGTSVPVGSNSTTPQPHQLLLRIRVMARLARIVLVLIPRIPPLLPVLLHIRVLV